jgi:hypothetical protein
MVARDVSRNMLPSCFGNGSIIASNVSFLYYHRITVVADDEMCFNGNSAAFSPSGLVIEFFAIL